jgi:hypothetical protein
VAQSLSCRRKRLAFPAISKAFLGQGMDDEAVRIAVLIFNRRLRKFTLKGI